MRLLVTAFLIAAPASAGIAQDAGGAFNMGQLTGTLSQDDVTQSERARAGSGENAEASARADRAAANCAKVSTLKARYGAEDPRIGKLIELCRRAGHEVR